ncbi:MAG: hypothetical protein ACM3X9_08000 [Bacillota bacterium]
MNKAIIIRAIDNLANEIKSPKSDMIQRFNEVDQRFKEVDQRLNKIDQ